MSLELVGRIISRDMASQENPVHDQLGVQSHIRLPRGGGIWAKWGRFGIFPVLCLLAYGDTALES